MAEKLFATHPDDREREKAWPFLPAFNDMQLLLE